MKEKAYILLLLITFTSCGQAETKNKNANKSISTVKPQKIYTTDSCANYDNLLIKYADSFEAKAVCLDESISAELRNFINKIDTNCLRKQTEYKFFIAAILAKLYVYHIDCCEVGSDLLGMKKGAASIIISEFQILAGYNVRGLEFLESGNIVSYIKHDPELRENKILEKLIKKFNWD